MIDIFKTIPVGLEMNILICITSILILSIIPLLVYSIKCPSATSVRKTSAVLIIMAFLPIGLLISIYTQITPAVPKGLEYIEWKKLTLEQIEEKAELAPAASKTPGNLSGAIVILYKFGCPDCEAIYPALKEKLQGNDNIYFVPSDSELGKKLIQDGHVQQVPTGVYIRKQPLANGATQNNIVLYTADKNGKSVLNEKALDHLMLLQEQGK